MVLVDSKGILRAPSYLGANFKLYGFRLQGFHLLGRYISVASSNICSLRKYCPTTLFIFVLFLKKCQSLVKGLWIFQDNLKLVLYDYDLPINIEFRLLSFRSPLLRESRLLSFPLATKMFQFARFTLSFKYIFYWESMKFPYSGIFGSKLAASSPKYFAG